ncbi:hypothetical protein Fsol_00370 [Candidatus Fokinia solitaria]|uniref:Uncharacterized protein n=1 Tax=Candidatus Fokinia solitaria TaxID=1802984 RepID=A0A2U8BS90_9RICK|nr:hypothetical protein [Candidatus Fokinia solitaria]AWD33168.1 hypothetical protein Fsol_00370 [Candidatus Fokinia solitaria]
MLNKNNTKSNEDKFKSNEDFFNSDITREVIHEYCEIILPLAPDILKFFLHKNGNVPRMELIKKFPTLTSSRDLDRVVEKLRHTLVGEAPYLPDYMLFNRHVHDAIRSIAVPIFMEEAQMMLQNQATPHHVTSNHLQQQQVAAPSPEQSQCAAPHSEIHDNSAMHYSDSDSID